MSTSQGFPKHPSELTQEIDPVAEYVKALSAVPSVRRLILFGSRAIGDNWPRSDVDMAVEYDGDRWDEVAAAAEQAWTLISIDLVDYERARGAFKDAIDRHGRVVYARA